MNYTTNKLEENIIEFTVNFTQEEWTDAQNKALAKLAKNITVPGFRKGSKIPDKIARKHIDKAQISQQAFDIILPVGYNFVLKNESELNIILQPSASLADMSETEISIKYTITCRPNVKLGQYRDFEIKKDNFLVGDDEVEAELLRIQKQNGTLVVVEEAAQLGDTVTIDFEGLLDGKPFDGGSAQNYVLELGSNQFIPGFEEQLVGAKANDSKDVNVVFPENYYAHLAGKPVIFKVLVHEVKRLELAPIDDNLAVAENIEGVSTLAELRNHLAGTIATKKEQEATNNAINTLYEKINDGCEVVIPSTLLKAEIDSRVNDIRERVEKNGITFDEYLKMINDTLEGIGEKQRDAALKSLKHALVVGQIIKDNKLEVTSQEIENEYISIAEKYSMDVNMVKERLKDKESELANQILDRKTKDFILSINKIN